ncbi:MAG TPA: AraC family transcriptional regulator [Candidatus Borkfalkia stercoripullorum]|nr:AraC family transcriptional regulator [Candidatus Borkfalkia stercoripullorum]
MKEGFDRKKFHIDHKYFLQPREFGDLTLLQIGERFCNAGSGFPEHEQICTEITYVYDGVALNTINGVTARMKANELNFTFPPQKHCISAPPDSTMRYFYIGFQLKESHPLYGELKKIEEQNGQVYLSDPFRTSTFFLNAITNNAADDALSAFVLKTSIDQILANFLRAYRGERKIGLSSVGNAEVVLFNMLSYLDENFLSFRNLSELSEKLGYCASYLSHLFHAAMRCSPTAYCLEKKLQYSLSLLGEENKSVTETAEILQYDTIHSFSKAFKSRFGVSPAAYKKDGST